MSPKVLYIDYEGHPAPLSRCFHATASRQLSSSVARHPPTTKTTVDSAYCPQCFSLNDAATAASLGFCESCKQCPLCMAIASVAVDTNNDDNDGQAFYKCGYCEWNSKACGIVTSIPLNKEDTMDKEKMMQANNTLADMARTKRDESLTAQMSHYQDMMTAWEQELKKDKQPPVNVKRSGIQPQTLQAWNLESLEESLVTKQQSKAPNFIGNQSEPSVVALDDSPTMLDETLQNVATTSLLLQPRASCNAITTFSNELLPLPLPLRARTSRRCLAELKEKRPGILVKPKLNPLEGDSSLKSGHGQWWKKDSSAIHVIPKLTIQQQHSSQHSFLLKVLNPNMCMVRLCLGPSNYTGRDNNPTIKHVLMDSLEVEYKNVLLDCNATSNMKATDTVELESVQDSFLEMGRTKLPDAVVKWSGTDSSSDETVCRLVACQKDVAWFELHVDPTANTGGNDSYVAVPLALQIQVGDGSWESSLIKQYEMDGPDFVTFDMLIAWEPNRSTRV